MPLWTTITCKPCRDLVRPRIGCQCADCTAKRASPERRREVAAKAGRASGNRNGRQTNAVRRAKLEAQVVRRRCQTCGQLACGHVART